MASPRKNWALVGLLTVVIVAIGAFGFLNWFLLIKIYDVTYLTKMGVSWWSVWTLDNQLFSAAILLTICSMITIPTRSTLYAVYAKYVGIAGIRPIGKRIVVVWRLIEVFGLFFLYLFNGGYSLSGVNVAFLLFLANTGVISITPAQFGSLIGLVVTPNASSSSVIALIPAMEAFNFYSGLASTVLIFTVIRIALLIVKDLFPPRPIAIFIKGAIVGALLSISNIFSVQTWTVNVGTWVSFLQIGVQTGLFVALLGFLLVYQHRYTGVKARRRELKKYKQDLSQITEDITRLRENPDHTSGGISPELSKLYKERREYAVDMLRLKNRESDILPIPVRSMAVIAVPLIIILAIAPLYHYFAYQIQMDGARYVDWKFDTEIQKQIDVTQWSGGTQDIQRYNISDFQSNTTSSGIEDLQHVRQWDQDASRTKMRNQIGVNWMQLADSDIIYLQGQEYWVAPLTLNLDSIEDDWLSETIRYTHAEGFVAINSFTGVVLSDTEFQNVFNVSSDSPIYYGDGYLDNEVYVGVDGYNEIGSYTYSGEPDYILEGIESSLWMLSKLQLSFMGQTMNMLIERDAQSRVGSILLQGLSTDNDIYPVYSPDGSVYFAVSIYTNNRLTTGYAQQNYLRFMGVGLVNALDGSIQLYRPQNMDSTDDFLESVYLSYYDWLDAPNWLQSQLKYPEDLWETQLSTDYQYHVDEAQIWLSGEDRFRLPTGQDVHYITLDYGGEIRYVGVQLVEFELGQGANLAGLYVVGSGVFNFGESSFYRAGGGDQILFGPKSALEAFEADPEVRVTLNLLGSHEIGNILLYQFNGALLYVIPVYVDTGSGSATITKLGGVGIVDALTGEQSAIGTDVIEAYQILFGNQTGIPSITGNITLGSPAFTDGDITPTTNTTLPLTMVNLDNVFHNATIRIVSYTTNIDIYRYGSLLTPVSNPTNQTYDLGYLQLGPSDSYGTTLVFSAELDPGAILEQYRLTLQIIENGTILESQELSLIVRES